MIRLATASAVLAWLGAVILLMQFRWFKRPPLYARLVPHLSRLSKAQTTTEPSHPRSFSEFLWQLATDLGERASSSIGGTESAATKLERIHSEMGLQAFRTRQVGAALAAFAIAALAATILPLPQVLLLMTLLLAPASAFVYAELRLNAASANWQRRLENELAVIAEQLGILLGSGASLGSAITRLAQRSHGAAAADLSRVSARVSQGVALTTALQEWDTIASTPAVRRLIRVLCLHSTEPDLASLVAAEAEVMRADSHRKLISALERREQQVWMPVTVAALVPGVILLGVPFIEALRLFTLS